MEPQFCHLYILTPSKTPCPRFKITPLLLKLPAQRFRITSLLLQTSCPKIQHCLTPCTKTLLQDSRFPHFFYKVPVPKFNILQLLPPTPCSKNEVSLISSTISLLQDSRFPYSFQKFPAPRFKIISYLQPQCTKIQDYLTPSTNTLLRDSRPRQTQCCNYYTTTKRLAYFNMPKIFLWLLENAVYLSILRVHVFRINITKHTSGYDLYIRNGQFLSFVMHKGIVQQPLNTILSTP